MDTISRRRFASISGGMLMAGGLGPGFAGAAERAPRRKLLVTVRDAHLSHVGERTCWSALKAIGADGVEVWVTADLACPYLIGADPKYSIATDDGVKRLRDDAGSKGLRISAFALANRFDERPDENIQWVARVAKACRLLRTEAIRIDVVPRRISNDDEFLKFAVQICKRALGATADTGVRLGIENHGHKTNDIAFLERLFEGVGSDRLGLTMDTGNFYWFGYPLSQLYEIYAKFAGRVFHTHCKTIAYPESKRNVRRKMGWQYGKYNCPLYDGDIDFKRVVSILRKAGYHGDLCVEDESLGKFPKAKRREVLAGEIAFLKKLA